MPRFTSRTLVALAFTLVVWASAFAGIRAGLRGYSPANLAIVRFLVASLVLAIYAGIAHFRRPELGDIPGLVLTGAIGITFYNLALNYGETRVTAGAASLLIASVPIWTALAARFWLHEKLTAIAWCGVLVSFAGVALISSGEGEGVRLLPQALIILAAAVTSALYMIMQKHYLGRYSALEFTAYSDLVRDGFDAAVRATAYCIACALLRPRQRWRSFIWVSFRERSLMWRGPTCFRTAPRDAPRRCST